MSSALLLNDILEDVGLVLVEPAVSTTLGTAVSPGTATVVPGSMQGIYVGAKLIIDSGAQQEVITVAFVSAITFVANFVNAHASTAPVVGATFPTGQPDAPLFTQDEMLGYLTEVQNDFLLRVRPLYAVTGLLTKAGLRYYNQPDTCIRLERLAMNSPDWTAYNRGSYGNIPFGGSPNGTQVIIPGTPGVPATPGSPFIPGTPGGPGVGPVTGSGVVVESKSASSLSVSPSGPSSNNNQTFGDQGVNYGFTLNVNVTTPIKKGDYGILLVSSQASVLFYTPSIQSIVDNFGNVWTTSGTGGQPESFQHWNTGAEAAAILSCATAPMLSAIPAGGTFTLTVTLASGTGPQTPHTLEAVFLNLTGVLFGAGGVTLHIDGRDGGTNTQSTIHSQHFFEDNGFYLAISYLQGTLVSNPGMFNPVTGLTGRIHAATFINTTGGVGTTPIDDTWTQTPSRCACISLVFNLAPVTVTLQVTLINEPKVGDWIIVTYVSHQPTGGGLAVSFADNAGNTMGISPIPGVDHLTLFNNTVSPGYLETSFAYKTTLTIPAFTVTATIGGIPGSAIMNVTLVTGVSNGAANPLSGQDATAPIVGTAADTSIAADTPNFLVSVGLCENQGMVASIDPNFTTANGLTVGTVSVGVASFQPQAAGTFTSSWSNAITFQPSPPLEFPSAGVYKFTNTTVVGPPPIPPTPPIPAVPGTPAIPGTPPITIVIGGVPLDLYETSQSNLDLSEPLWQSEQNPPREWFRDQINTAMFGLYPTPSTISAVEMWYSVRGPVTGNTLNTPLLVPPVFGHYMKYGVLNRAFSKDGEFRDIQRSDYCMRRYLLGVYLGIKFMSALGLNLPKESRGEPDFSPMPVPQGVQA